MSVTHGQCDVRPTVTFPAAEHQHRSLTGTKLQAYCLVNRITCVNSLPKVHRMRVELATSRSLVGYASHTAPCSVTKCASCLTLVACVLCRPTLAVGETTSLTVDDNLHSESLTSGIRGNLYHGTESYTQAYIGLPTCATGRRIDIARASWLVNHASRFLQQLYTPPHALFGVRRTT